MSLPLSGLDSEFGHMGVNVVNELRDFFDPRQVSRNMEPNLLKLRAAISSKKAVSSFRDTMVRTLER